MPGRSPRERARENLSGIVSVVVTGTWLAAMFLGFDWWLAFMLFGYIVVVPVVAMLFDEDDDADRGSEWTPRGVGENDAQSTDAADSADNALQTLRDRYARGEITEQQFERKLERLLETETLEDVEDQRRERLREFER